MQTVCTVLGCLVLVALLLVAAAIITVLIGDMVLKRKEGVRLRKLEDVLEDVSRWCAHDKKVDATCQYVLRHLRFLRGDGEMPQEDVSTFRQKNGLHPDEYFPRSTPKGPPTAPNSPPSPDSVFAEAPRWADRMFEETRSLSIHLARFPDNAGEFPAGTQDRWIAAEFWLAEEWERESVTRITRQTSPFYQGVKWSVKRLNKCLNKAGDWECEPMPSSRDDAFYGRCRYDSFGLAVEAYRKTICPQCKRTRGEFCGANCV